MAIGFQIFAKKLITLPLTLWFLATITFFMVRSAPGSPFSSERDLDPITEKALLAKFHLDQPLEVQYGIFLLDLVKGDLGPSMKQNSITVQSIIQQNLPPSVTLGVLAMAIALILGIGLGVVAALHQHRPLDMTSMILSVLGLSLPSFVIGPLLQIYFTIFWPVFPTAGYQGLTSPQYLILPAITLSLPFAARIARLTRGGLLDVLSQNYIKTAKAKGLPQNMILFRHALRGALLPVATYLGPALAGVTTGTLVVERIFQIPGMGREFVESALNRDYTLVMGTVLVYGSFLIICNALSDLLCAWLNPRLRSQL
jgi:oligopeptide transport system permease protein